jgi:ketosteroid isomerase-like protein
MDMQRYDRVQAMVERFYQLSGAGLWDEAEAMMTDDFCIVEADSMPYPGRFAGKSALRELYTTVFGYWDDPVLETHDVCIGASHAVVMLTMKATSRHNGERLAMPIAEVLHLRGDRFCGITPYYFDTAAIARATGVLSI